VEFIAYISIDYIVIISFVYVFVTLLSLHLKMSTIMYTAKGASTPVRSIRQVVKVVQFSLC